MQNAERQRGIGSAAGGGCSPWVAQPGRLCHIQAKFRLCQIQAKFRLCHIQAVLHSGAGGGLGVAAEGVAGEAIRLAGALDEGAIIGISGLFGVGFEHDQAAIE